MDSAVGELAVVLAGIYLLDCLRWVGRRATLFRWVPLLGWRAEGPWTVGPQFARLLALGNPLPLGALLGAEGFILRPQPEGWVIDTEPWGTLPGADSRTVQWEALDQVSIEGLDLRVDGERLYTFSSRRAAQAQRKLLAALAPAARQGARKRRARIERALAGAFDSRVLEQRLAHWRPWRLRVSVTNTALLLALAGFLALLVNATIPWWWALPALGAAWALALVCNVLATRAVLPPAVRPGAMHFVGLALSPLSLMRGADVIEAELVGDLHPLAIATGLLPAPACARYLSGALRELRHPLVPPSGPAPALAEGDRWFRSRLEARILALAEARELTLQLAGRAAPHCPRCLSEYVAPGPAECVSCAGVKLGPAAYR